uniref:Uncharacterized protein n=1 Tax=Ditylenchus dipsaci TaxID=166011 RepID=A0A915DR78_9BILA
MAAVDGKNRAEKFLRDVYKLTNIMVNVLIRIQGESYVTISLCYGYLKALKKSILKSKENVSKRDLELAISSIQPLIDCQATSGQSTSNVQPTNELDPYLEEIAQEELEQRQSRAGIQAGAKSWIGDILRRGITAKASTSSSIDPLVYWQKLIDTVIFCHSITSLDKFALGVQVTGDYGSRDFNSSRNECTYQARLLLSWSCNKKTKK